MADRDLRIRLLLEAADRVSRPLRDIAGGSTRAAQAMRATRDQLKSIDRAQKDIAGFRELKRGLSQTGVELRQARTQLAGARAAIAAVDKPTRAMARSLKAAEQQMAKVRQRGSEQAHQLREVRARMQEAGVSTKKLAHHERELADQAARTNRTLAQQTRRLEQVADRQRRFSAARERFGRGQQIAGSMAVGGAAALGSGVALARPLVGTIGAAQAFQSGMTDIAQKANLTRVEADRMGASLLAAAKAANQMPEDLRAGVDVLAGFGLDPRQAVEMMRPIGRAATAYKAEIADLSAAGFAGVDNLKVPIAQTGRMIDIMAQAGKEGAFEIKDMASAFPALTAAYAGLGQKGLGAVGDLAAGLQITRKGAGDSAQAATNLSNILQKMVSPRTNKAFEKMGVDLPAALKKMYAEGKTPLEAITELTNKTLKGDLSKLGYLFADSQVQQGLRPLIQNFEEFKRIRAEAMGASGVTDGDFAERMKDSAEQTRAMKANAAALAIQLGTVLLPAANAVLEKATALAARFGNWAQRHPALTKALLLTAGGLSALLLVLGVVGIAIAGIIGPMYAFAAVSTYTGIALLPLIGTVLAVLAVLALWGTAAYMIYAKWGKITAFFSDIWTRVKATFAGGIGSITAALVNWSPIGVLWRLLSMGLNALGISAPARFTELGRNMIGGLIRGITGMLGALRDTVVGAASSAAAWFKTKLGIHSPSRVFAGFGGFMMQGLANGIAGGAADPVRRIDGLSRKLTRALATGVAAPMVATVAAAAGAAPGDSGGAARTAGYAAPITINIYGAPGQSPDALARAVADELDRRERGARAAARSSFRDDSDGADR